MGERGSMTAAEFVEKWRGRNLSERQAAHAHFIELCRLLDVPAPLDHAGDDHEYMFDALTTSAGSKVYAAAKGKRGRKADGTTAPPKAASDKGPPTPHPLPPGRGR